MRFGSREVCNVVIKDIANKKPKIYLETLKMNNIEVGSNTVYAVGGQGMPKLIGWSGKKDVKFKNEDALLSPESFAVLSGSKISREKKVIHKKEKFEVDENKKVILSHEPSVDKKHIFYVALSDISGTIPSKELTKAKSSGSPTSEEYDIDKSDNKTVIVHEDLVGKTILIDYYYMSEANVTTLTITSDDFPKTFTLEADTLFRTEDGIDRPCHITIPKAKLEGKFSVNMKGDGDPSTFKFDFECLKPSNGKDMVVFDIEMDEE
ncbi:hypothetical protein ADU76_02365 (plasmid) [Clostridium botulinum]|uniref:hypothetical protein n=1 Tax=Clostridium botulinum TaxID=1491 RepID=UPI00069C70F7|nr:hypothetical protein [Clostridium botulinum]KOA94863.1 hypothetical protein ADU76_02365 [Clostridium botulinum]